MPTVDIVIHIKGLFTLNEFIYHNVREHSITYTDKIAIIRFNYTPKYGKRKGKDVHYQKDIPLENLYYAGVRTYE